MQTDAPEQWRKELDRGLQRMKNFTSLVMDRSEPAVGCTPRREVYRKHKARLYRYGTGGSHRTPILFVPNLGISRPYIFDLQPNASFVEYMVGQGFDFYLLDWGVFGPEDDHMTLEDCVVRILPRVARKVLQASGADDLNILGYCMGAPLSACFIATHPEMPVRSFVNMAGPIDFSKGGMFRLWLDPRYFDADKLVDTLGTVPSELIQAGFKMLKPTMDTATGLALWWNLWNDDYVKGFKALNKWANEYVGFPGGFFRQWVKDFYQQNRMFAGDLTLGGRVVDLQSITCPVLVVGARQDYIVPPDCAQALTSAVGSTDTSYLELPGGHISLIAGRSASVHCWPRVSGWLAERSAA
ncbi:MAG: alpha/beta fold hydrolase [Acidimicrobiia bacterium]|nr:alpha/beta fold hydrolase [Acidimicrobiia bacterium]